MGLIARSIWLTVRVRIPSLLCYLIEGPLAKIGPSCCCCLHGSHKSPRKSRRRFECAFLFLFCSQLPHEPFVYSCTVHIGRLQMSGNLLNPSSAFQKLLNFDGTERPPRTLCGLVKLVPAIACLEHSFKYVPAISRRSVYAIILSRYGCDTWMAPSVVIPPLLAPPVPCLVAACETRKYGNIMRAAANRLGLTGRKSTFETGITFCYVEGASSYPNSCA